MAHVLDKGIAILMIIFISRIAEKTVFRAILTLLGFYLLTVHLGQEYYLFENIDTVIGIGLIVPHFTFWIKYFQDFIIKTINVTYNFYTLGLTIFYKIRNLFVYIFSIFGKINIFFQKRKYDKAKKEYESKKEQEQQEENYYEEQEYQNSYEQEERTYSSNNDYSQEQNSSNSQNDYTDDREENNPYEKEFDRFYSTDYYIIIGVTIIDDYSIIKKKYRELAHIYHPDNNMEEWDKYNEIFKKINEAHEYLQKRHK